MFPCSTLSVPFPHPFVRHPLYPSPLPDPLPSDQFSLSPLYTSPSTGPHVPLSLVRQDFFSLDPSLLLSPMSSELDTSYGFPPFLLSFPVPPLCLSYFPSVHVPFFPVLLFLSRQVRPVGLLTSHSPTLFSPLSGPTPLSFTPSSLVFTNSFLLCSLPDPSSPPSSFLPPQALTRGFTFPYTSMAFCIPTPVPPFFPLSPLSFFRSPSLAPHISLGHFASSRGSRVDTGRLRS